MFQSHESRDFPSSKKFLKYAASSCGMPAELHGTQEALRPEGEIMLGLPQPFQASAFCRANIPPIVVKVTKLCLLGNQKTNSSEENSRIDRVFTGTAVKSIHPAISEGNTVIGMVSQGCDALVMNAHDPEAMDHLLETYEDKQCMRNVAL